MNKVLVPMAVNTAEDGSVNYFVRPTYLNALEVVGLEPVLVSGEFSEEQLKEEYRKTSGVMFMGGWDINPKFYGDALHTKTALAELGRDELELKILSWAKENKKPYLGICRGHQLLNVLLGGSLFQHLSEITLEEHSVGKYENLGQVLHEVEIDETSRLGKIVGEKKIMTNSGHHQAINKLGEGLRVVGKSKAGIIEAVEWLGHDWFALGVQWHPEADFNIDSKKIFEAFAKETLKSTN